MPYHDNPQDKKVIDCVLKRNAIMFANLGADSSREEYAKAKEIEVQRLQRIRHFDPDKIDLLIRSTDL